jgi:hypothetical protein
VRWAGHVVTMPLLPKIACRQRAAEAVVQHARH